MRACERDPGDPDVYVGDLQEGTAELVSVTRAGRQAHGQLPAISGDGRFVSKRASVSDEGRSTVFGGWNPNLEGSGGGGRESNPPDPDTGPLRF